MTDIKSVLIPAAATPALQAILNLLGQLNLTPLAHWEWNDTIALAITYVVSTGSAAVAGLLIPSTNTGKAIALISGIIVLLASLWGYTWVTTTPPPAGSLGMYDIIAYVSYFATYAAFGYSVTGVVGFFTSKPKQPSD